MTEGHAALPQDSVVWVYPRASVPEQERGTIEGQREFIENWAQEQDLVITRCFADEAKPGYVVFADRFNPGKTTLAVSTYLHLANRGLKRVIDGLSLG